MPANNNHPYLGQDARSNQPYPDLPPLAKKAQAKHIPVNKVLPFNYHATRPDMSQDSQHSQQLSHSLYDKKSRLESIVNSKLKSPAAGQGQKTSSHQSIQHQHQHQNQHNHQHQKNSPLQPNRSQAVHPKSSPRHASNIPQPGASSFRPIQGSPMSSDSETYNDKLEASDIGANAVRKSTSAVELPTHSENFGVGEIV